MAYFDYKRRNLFAGPHLIGIILGVTGLFASLTPLFLDIEASLTKTLLVGLGALFLGLLIISTYEGTSIDIDRRRQREYLACCGFRFGKWLPLPVISQVKMVPNTYRSTNMRNGISPTLSGYITDFHIFLYTSESDQPFLSYAFSKEKQARMKAEALAKRLEVPLEIVRDA